MNKLLVSALALAAMSSVAMAAPAQLSDRQMDTIAAGSIFDNNVSFISQRATSISAAVCVHCEGETGRTVAVGGGSLAASSGLSVSSASSATNVAIVKQR